MKNESGRWAVNSCLRQAQTILEPIENRTFPGYQTKPVEARRENAL